MQLLSCVAQFAGVVGVGGEGGGGGGVLQRYLNPEVDGHRSCARVFLLEVGFSLLHADEGEEEEKKGVLESSSSSSSSG